MMIIATSIKLSQVKEMTKAGFGNLVKAVVDIEKEIMAIDGELHADEEELLLKKGSKQKYLWGINIYPEMERDNMIEFDSMINLKPGADNLNRGVDDKAIREKIINIVQKLIIP